MMIGVNFVAWESFVGIAFVLASFGIYLGITYSWILGVSFFWMGFSGARLFAAVSSPYEGYSVPFVFGTDLKASCAIAEFVSVTIGALFIPEKLAIYFFRLISVINGIILLIGVFHPGVYGLLINPSMSGCLEVVLLPMIWRFSKLERAVGILSILGTPRHMVLGSIALLGLTYLVKKSKLWLSVLPIGFIALVVLSQMSSIRPLAERLFDSNGRGMAWHLSFAWWQMHSFFWKLLGAGSGSFSLIGPELTKPTGYRWFWMHSDWLQILWEQGVIGIILAFSCFGLFLWRARRHWVFYSLIAYGFVALANMPLRYPVFALLGAFLVRLSLEEKTDHVDKILLA